MRHEPLLALALLATGCVTGRHYPAPDLPADSHTVPSATPAAPPRPARTALVLSSGGAYGAFTAGVLKGWSEAGTRPEFDVVTGVSTGALIAPLAFLGPEFDRELEAQYTTTRDRDVFRRRSLPAVLWSDSLADPAPLRARIEATATPALLDRVAAEHRKGRRLYAGTTDLDTRRPVVWDLGAIAAGPDPDRRRLFCDVILASCSVPAVFPPVAIDVEVDGRRFTELHADGGVSRSAFLPPAVLGVGPAGEVDPSAPGADVYVILAGNLAPRRGPVERRLLRVSGEALAGVLHAREEGDLLRLYMLARHAGAEFHLAAVPDDLPADGPGLGFDPRAMRRLFVAGEKTGRSDRWRGLPPGLGPGERPVPREGVHLKTVTRPRPAKEIAAPSLLRPLVEGGGGASG
jgi:predicted patatin/cPLA2 family phospholipase